MLASRTLPPITSRSPSPPIATFVNIPRRYYKAKMQATDVASGSKMQDVQPASNTRKSSRINDSPSSDVENSAQRSAASKGPTSAPLLPLAPRKRTASVGANGTSFEVGDSPTNSRPGSATSTGSGEISGHICLCPPEPKIPRPRNAFILYRQHHQHAIVARYPGLSNPEISKIIGEQWNAESPDQKGHWSRLAQEEKLKHQEQYPEYRYQPRRGGRLGSLPQGSPGPTTTDKYRCGKCGGRNIKTPTSPFPASPPATLPPISASANSSPTTRYLPTMTSLSLESPALRRGRPGPSNLSSIQVPSTSHAEPPSMYSPGTPDSKRRRYNYPTAPNGRRGETPYYGHRRESLPHLGQMRPSPPNTATMLPPPRTPREPRRGSVDLNVLVPNQHDQSRSVEAMVMSVPPIIKIKVLGRITPPLKEPGPTSPAIQVRGAIIAIEGDDTSAVKELSEWLNDFLSKAPEYAPRIETPPKEPKQGTKDLSFEDYLDLIKEWHGRSREMIRYITTPVGSRSSADRDHDMDSANASPSSDKSKDSKDSAPSSPDLKKKPVVILPTYQLHASDVYTSRIPIQDAYAPTDHWQWMATLWRGTVGPDLTIYVSEGLVGRDGKEGKQVELDEAVRCLTVRKERGDKFSESALRRVGFEVGEWVRDVGGKTGGS